MTQTIRLSAVASLAALALGVAACTPAADETADAPSTSTTIVETREVPTAPVVIEREVAVPGAPIVIERDGRPAGDSTTVRAGRDGIEVETTNR
ncbi:hypothetical protein [Brevundimonas sp.]|uniref:hypothetical protein n=1 Tax=Brevundimonas sp. TaxID=1871086 RepID=UPI003566C255